MPASDIAYRGPPSIHQVGGPTFTHIRYLSVQEPDSGFEGLGELISLAAATGAHMHICHLNSVAGRDIKACVELVSEAQERGLPITVEAHPYGACSSTVGAEVFRKDRLARWGVEDASAMELNGEPLTQDKIDELQEKDPCAVIVMHFLRPDDNDADAEMLDLSVLHPGAAIASDRMPWARKDGTIVEGDAWPLPDDAFAHPAETVGCSGVTAWRRLRDWTVAGVWPRLHAALLTELRRAKLLNLNDCAVDGSHVRALKGGSHVGPSPVDRARPGSKHHLIVDRHGTPLAVALTGGNRHDVTQLLPLLDAIPPIRGLCGRPRRKPRRLYADRGYDFDKYRRLLWKRGIKPLIARRGVAHGSGLGKVRWVVERAFACLHQFKRLRARYERRADLDQSLLELVCSIICLRRLRKSF